RIDVGHQRIWPLGSVLRVPPSGFVRVDVAFGALPEGHRLRGLELGLPTRGFAGFDRINPVEPHAPALPRFFASLAEADCVQRAEPHLVLAPGFLVTEHPGFRPGGAHLQIKAASVAVVAAALRLIDSQGCQLSDRPYHRRPPSRTTHLLT